MRTYIFDLYKVPDYYEGNLHGSVANVLDFNITVSKFKLELCRYVCFRTSTCRKGMNLNCRLNSTTVVLLQG